MCRISPTRTLNSRRISGFVCLLQTDKGPEAEAVVLKTAVEVVVVMVECYNSFKMMKV